MTMNMHRSHVPVLWMLAIPSLALLAGAGCGSGDDGASSKSADLGASYDNLNTDLSICDKARDDCLDAADGNPGAIQACKDERASCADAIKEARTEVHDALRACVATARDCVHAALGDGGFRQLESDAGRSAIRECGDAFRSCVKAALPAIQLPPCVQTAARCFEAASSGDGGRAAREACAEQFKTCAEAELPPCLHAFATCMDEGGTLRSCLPPERECRDYRMTHDGGVPPAN